MKLPNKPFISAMAGIAACLLLTSCLTAGLDPLPVYEDAEITNFKFEHRYKVKQGTSEMLQVKEMKINDLNIDKEKATVTLSITVPPADLPGKGNFTEAVRNDVSLSKIWGYCSISPAAHIEPIGDAPALGTPGDFSKKSLKYRVTAADKKTVKEWTLIITGLRK